MSQPQSLMLRRHGCPEYEALIDMTEILCKTLVIKDLIPTMISCRVIDIADIDKLCSGRTDQKIVEKFIKDHLYPDLVLRDTNRFEAFVKAMKTSSKCDVLVKKLEERIKHHQKYLQSGTYYEYMHTS